MFASFMSASMDCYTMNFMFVPMDGFSIGFVFSIGFEYRSICGITNYFGNGFGNDFGKQPIQHKEPPGKNQRFPMLKSTL